MYVVSILPFKYSFINSEYKYWDLAENGFDFIFFADLVLTFFKAIEKGNSLDEDEDLEMRISRIALKYFSFWFWVDLISILPFEYLISVGDMSIFIRMSKLPRLYKIIKLSKVIRSSKGIQNSSGCIAEIKRQLILMEGLGEVLSNSVSLLLFSHLFACFWHLAASFEDPHRNWIVANGFEDQGAGGRYLVSLYWVVQTITTVGYGDIIISNMFEQIIAILGMLAGVIFFSITVSSLSRIVGNSDKKKEVYEKKKSVLYDLNDKYGISAETMGLLMDVLKLNILNNDSDLYKLLYSIPENLFLELSFEIHKSMVKGMPIFENYGKKFIAYVCPKLKLEQYNPGTTIFSLGEYAGSMCFIKEGDVALMTDDIPSTAFVHYGNGECIGEIDMLFKQTRKFKCISISRVQLLTLSKEDFEEIIIKEFPLIWKEMSDAAENKREEQITLHNRTKRKTSTIIPRASNLHMEEAQFFRPVIYFINL